MAEEKKSKTINQQKSTTKNENSSIKTKSKQNGSVTNKKKANVSHKKKNSSRTKDSQISMKKASVSHENKASSLNTKRILEETVLEPMENEIALKSDASFKEIINPKKEIPVSHYIIAAGILVFVFLFSFFGYKMFQAYQEKLYQNGYFIHAKANIQTVSLNEVKQLTNKPQVFIFFNYRGYEETYQLEKDLNQIIQDYHLQNNFYYVDLTSFENEIMVQKMNESLGLALFQNVPAIAYYQDGKLVTIAQREDQKVLEAADFVKVLDMYEFKK